MTITTKRHIQSVSSLLVMMFILFFVGCTYDGDDLFSKNEAGVQLNFSIDLPTKASQGGTRALSPTDENNISHIYVLAFEDSGNNNYKLVEKASTNSIQSSGTNDKEKGFTVTFTDIDVSNKYKFVLLANVEDGGLDSYTKGASREEILNKLIVTLDGDNTPWSSITTDANYRPIPMWGETEGSIPIPSDLKIGGINLLRMLSRINVLVSSDAPQGGGATAQSYFKLSSVHLFQSHKDGRVAPDSVNLVTGLKTEVAKPTLAGNTKNPTVGRGVEYPSTDDTELTNTIYTFEADNTSDNIGHGDMTCLVIGGKYNGEDEPTYYRVNFHNANGDNTDILRNHNYNIKIVSISGSGYDTPEEAFKSNAINMETEVVEWNDAGMGEIHESDGYRLAISPSSIVNFNRLGGYWLNVELNTNYPDGWKLVKVTESNGTTEINHSTGWIKLRIDDGKSIEKDKWQGTNKKLSISTDPISDGFVGAERVGYIHVQFAKTIVKIEVKQDTAYWPTIEVVDEYGNPVDEILFEVGVDEDVNKMFTLNWTPTNSKVIVSNIILDKTPVFSGDYTPSGELNNTTGCYKYGIKPNKMTKEELDRPLPFEKGMEQIFRIENTNIEKRVRIRHVNNAISVKLKPTPYVLNGMYNASFVGDHSFEVFSTIPWRIDNVTDEKGVLKVSDVTNTNDNIIAANNLKIGFENTETDYTETTVTFATRYDYWESGNIEVVIAPINAGDFEPINIVLQTTTHPEYYPIAHGGWAGSNIYWKDGKMIFDDVGNKENENYQGLFFIWSSLCGLSPSTGVWPGKNLYKPNGNVETQAPWATWNKVKGSNLAPVEPLPLNKVLKDRASLYEVDITKGATTEIGDICKYITEWHGGTLHDKKWRMPTMTECLPPISSSREGGFGAINVINQYGSHIVPSKTKFNYNGTEVSLPASGYLANNIGTSMYYGVEGGYWSSSIAINTAEAWRTAFFANSGNELAIEYRYSFSVRCVVDTEATEIALKELESKENKGQ